MNIAADDTTNLNDSDVTNNTDNNELVIEINDGSQPSPDNDLNSNEETPIWVKDLRKKQTELTKENRELKDKLKEIIKPDVETTLPDKPSLAGCGYDDVRFETELEQWHDKKREIDKLKQTKQAEVETANKTWQDKLNSYETAKTSLKVPDFNESEETVKSFLSIVQQGIIINGAKKPEILIYAIGKNPELAEKLSKIQDPIKFAFEVSTIENNLKVSSKEKTLQPMKAVKSSNVVASTDATLQKLRDEAERTGDYTKVTAYKKQLKKT